MRTGFLRLFIFFCLQSTCELLYSQTPYYPDSVWQTKKAGELKMNAALLDSAVSFAIHNDSKTDYHMRIANMKEYGNEPNYRILGPMKDRGNPTGIIIRKGYIVAQWGDVKRVDMTNSVTKSYLSTIAGLAVDRRLIKSVDDHANEYVTDETYEGVHNSKITWRHLLTQSSDWSGCMFDLWTGPTDRPKKVALMNGRIGSYENLEPTLSIMISGLIY